MITACYIYKPHSAISSEKLTASNYLASSESALGLGKIITVPACRSQDHPKLLLFVQRTRCVQDVGELLPAAEESRPRAVRVNTIKTTVEDALSRLKVGCSIPQRHVQDPCASAYCLLIVWLDCLFLDLHVSYAIAGMACRRTLAQQSLTISWTISLFFRAHAPCMTIPGSRMGTSSCRWDHHSCRCWPSTCNNAMKHVTGIYTDKMAVKQIPSPTTAWNKFGLMLDVVTK